MPAKKQARVSDVVAALEKGWASIQRKHPEVADVAIVVASKGRKPLYGYHAPQRWAPTKGKAPAIAEVLIAAEHINRGADEVFATLLHESVHSENAALKIKDVSGNQRHNLKFRAKAVEFGLKCEPDEKYGTVTTGLEPETKKAYARDIAAIGKVLASFRREETKKQKPKDRNLAVGQCPECGAKVRATVATIESGLIHAEDDQEFELL